MKLSALAKIALDNMDHRLAIKVLAHIRYTALAYDQDIKRGLRAMSKVMMHLESDLDHLAQQAPALRKTEDFKDIVGQIKKYKDLIKAIASQLSVEQLLASGVKDTTQIPALHALNDWRYRTFVAGNRFFLANDLITNPDMYDWDGSSDKLIDAIKLIIKGAAESLKPKHQQLTDH